MWKLIYNFLIFPFVLIFFLIGSIFVKKIRKGFFGRLASIKKIRMFSSNLDEKDSVYWFHASSHGEFEQIKPILDRIKKINPRIKVLLSFFSPSGYDNVKDDLIDCKLYIPFDFYFTTKKVFEIISPKKLIFAGYDIWPNFIWSAYQKKIHTVIFAATFTFHKKTFSTLVKNFYKSLYINISAFYTINDDDSERIKNLTLKRPNIIIKTMGNPRFDRVKEKSDALKINKNLMKRTKRIILGSIHNSDKNIIIESLSKLILNDNKLGCIWAPDEIIESRMLDIEVFFKNKNISIERLGSKSINEIKSKVILIDTIGKLYNSYWYGQIAYIGGGFSPSGVHNVMEPAIAKLPVFFGPNYTKSQEAKQLINAGGGFKINNGTDFYNEIRSLFSNKEQLVKSSHSSKSVIDNNLGSSKRVALGILND
tara:strand:- start:798 stop:2066 length:1269 start_codon:yes stop_codon:yes gene_type:complete